MERMWEEIWVWGNAAVPLIFGAALAIDSVAGSFKKRFRFARTVALFFIGIAFIAVGLLQLVDVVRKEWIPVIAFAALGVLLILEGACTVPLFVTIREYAGRTLTVIVGIVIASFAVLTLLQAYR